MICKKILLLGCIAVSVESIEAKTSSDLVKSVISIVARAKNATLQKYDQVKDITKTQVKSLQDKFKIDTNQNSTTTTSIFQGNSSMPGIGQASKTEAEQAATASGLLNFAKNSTITTNNITHNHYYAPKTVVDRIFDWVKNGGQIRAARAGFGAGFGVGIFGGYGLHAAVTSKEKTIIMQDTSEKS